MNQLKQITLAQNMYSDDYDGWIVVSYVASGTPVDTWVDLLCKNGYGPTWVGDLYKGTFRCPSEPYKNTCGNYIANAYAVGIKGFSTYPARRNVFVSEPSTAVFAADGGCENPYNQIGYYAAFRHGGIDPRTRPLASPPTTTGITGKANWGFFDGHVETQSYKFWDAKPARNINGAVYPVANNAFTYGLDLGKAGTAF